MRFVVDFEKAFDSVQSERLRNTMRSYGIPDHEDHGRDNTGRVNS